MLIYSKKIISHTKGKKHFEETEQASEPESGMAELSEHNSGDGYKGSDFTAIQFTHVTEFNLYPLILLK